jgi:uncharacterized protein YlbG (UPF0298 family)
MIKFTPTDYPLKIFLLNTMLKTAESTTFLGLQLDNHLTCKAHVNQLLHKLSTVGFQMRKLHRSATKKLHTILLLFIIYFYSLKPEKIVKKFHHVNFFLQNSYF